MNRFRFVKRPVFFVATVSLGVVSAVVLTLPSVSSSSAAKLFDRPLAARANSTESVAYQSCSSQDLTVEVWALPPAMTQGLDGFNLVNSGSAPCQLPASANVVSIVDATGQPLSASDVMVSGGEGITSAFVPLGDASTSTSPITIPVEPSPIVLQPGDKAVEMLFTFAPIDNINGQFQCLAIPNGARVGIGTGNGQIITGVIPSSNALESDINPSGSAISSCGVVGVAPFVTWQQAVSLIGPPLSGSNQEMSGMADSNLFQYAP